MTVHKITAGDGYTYLTRQVAAGDSSPERGRSAATYYTATGNPPGTWMGSGLHALGLSGTVSEEQMTALFGQGQHPNAVGIVTKYQHEHVVADMSPRQLETVNERARKAASLGRPFPQYQALAPFDARVSARLEAVRNEVGRPPTAAEEKKIRREEARRQRRAVAGFDLVFTPVSSVSRLWGLDPRPWVREAIEQAHYAARDAALRLLEEHAAHTRTGSSGQAQIEAQGLIAAVFDHADNRLGEPNLHSHVAVSSKVFGANGKWQALDARGLYRMTVAASELYNTTLENELHTRLGLEFETRPDTAGKREPVREIKGFPPNVLSHFTRRRADIEAEYQQLVIEYRATHGRDPSLPAAHELAQQAALATRNGKKPPRAWATMRNEWRADLLSAFGTDALTAVMAVVSDRRKTKPKLITRSQLDVAEIADRVMTEVQEHHATWTRWSVLAQTHRELRGTRFTTPAEQESAVAAVVEAALSKWSISTEPPEALAEPSELRRSDGSSVFTQHGAERYTSQAILDAETRLVDAARFQTSVGVDGQTTEQAMTDHELRTGEHLDPGQRALVRAFACGGRLLMAGIGPAGTGKTTAMKALTEVINAGETGRLVPLATSAAAAGVLSAELGLQAENLHKFLWEWMRGPHAESLAGGRKIPPQLDPFVLNAGDIVLVDEAGMAGTLNLDRLVNIAAEQGAVVRLLGDYRQLGAVESGGALRLIANETGAVELSTLYRFTDPMEAEATLKIRTGDTAGLDFYQAAGRIQHGSRQSMTEQAYADWKADMLAGQKALMVAATNADVAELCARARADRVAAGQVEADGVRLHDGNLAGVHDLIVTRDNSRRLRSGSHDFVKNGDAWRVVERHDDGSLTIEHLEYRGRVTLPPKYVATNVELLYATTAHRAQGSTVDACHALITEEMGRENFYVIASRARHHTMLYVATHELASLDQDEHVDAVRFDADAYAAREILEHVVARETAELSATEQIRASFADAESLSSLVPRYEHALDVATDAHYRRIVEAVIPEMAAEIIGDSAWHAVLRALRDAEAAGWDVAALLRRTTHNRELATADSLAQVISWRLRRVLDAESTPAVDDLRYRRILARLAPTLVPSPSPTAPASGVTTDVEWEQLCKNALQRVLGPIRAAQAHHDVAWPAFSLALHRANAHGIDPAEAIKATAGHWRLRSAAPAGQSAALAIHQLLDARATDTTADRHSAWRRITQSLARLEQAGADPAAVLTDELAKARVGGQEATLSALATQLQAAAGHVDGPLLPAWLRTVQPVTDTQWQPYLNARAALIRQRVSHLAEAAAADRPAWTQHLGSEPADQAERESWLSHLAALAAYRDQYKINDDDPNHPLGPYPESGRAGHHAYWIAAASLLALRGARTPTDPSWGRLAADRYRTLDHEEQKRIATSLAKRLGHDWLGDIRDPAADADQPVYRGHLATILIEHGHLADPHQAVLRDRAPSVRSRARQRQGSVVVKTGRRPTHVGKAQAPKGPSPASFQRPPQPPPDQPDAPKPGR